MKNTPIDFVIVGDRHRKQMGDLNSLADSIAEHGLLQPIGITKDRKLVFGERRLRACRDVLKWTEIPARIVDVASIVEGEYAENQVRKDFTPSERVAIAKTIEELITERLGERRGRPPEAGDTEKADDHPELPEVSKGDETRQVAAKAAGFNSDFSYRQAKTVVENGAPELVAAMDNGAVSINAAANLTHLSPEKQADAVSKPKAEVVQLAQEAAGHTVEKEDKGTSNPHGYVTLEEWNTLHPQARAALFDFGQETEAGFNRQKGDMIDWAQWSWNPVTGCLHDCPYCYARDIANHRFPQKFAPTLIPGRLAAPRCMRVPAKAADDGRYKNVFVCSMADLFGRWVPEIWIEAVLDAAREAPQWNFLFLTKFPQRMAEFDIPQNAWMGTTVDCQARVANAEKAFAKVKCDVRWLSVEPLIEPLKFRHLNRFDWLVIGGASESTKTPAWHPPLSWVEDLEGQAAEAGCRVYRKPNLFTPRREMPWDKACPTPDRAPDSFHYLGRKTGEAG